MDWVPGTTLNCAPLRQGVICRCGVVVAPPLPLLLTIGVSCVSRWEPNGKPLNTVSLSWDLACTCSVRVLELLVS
eukprot:1802537-Amphidinium_carterae.1